MRRDQKATACVLSWSQLPSRRTVIASDISAEELVERLNQLREREPAPFVGTPQDIEEYVLAAAELLRLARNSPTDGLSEAQLRYLGEAAMRQVRFARARVDTDRHNALEILQRLFRLGSPPRPDGRYEGELIAMSTGLLSDPFFEWMTRIYLPWRGKTFDAASATGDNVFSDNTWSKATEKLGWPGYRAPSDLPGTVRVFPFESSVAPGIEDPETRVLRLDYSHSQNPLPVRRIVDEVVELPGGYLLGKAHMRGLREFRRVCFFGLLPPG